MVWPQNILKLFDWTMSCFYDLRGIDDEAAACKAWYHFGAYDVTFSKAFFLSGDVLRMKKNDDGDFL